MDLRLQKRLAADVLKSSPKRIWFDPTKLQDISESITKADIRELVSEGFIAVEQKKGISRARANVRKTQYKKGLRRGWGSRKGTPNARVPGKVRWMLKVRTQRKFLAELKEKKILSTTNYRKLYMMSKGGFFRSKRHIKLYIDENKLGEKK